MEIFQFDRREKVIEYFGSQGLRATRIATGDGEVRLVISGEGWTAGPDGARVPVAAGQGVRWDAGEVHTTGTGTGLVAIAVEGAPMSLFEPEEPELPSVP